MPYEGSLKKFYDRLVDLNKHIIMVNEYVEQKSLELRINEIINKKIIIENHS